MIVSFAWTTQAYLDGKKTVTRRVWTDQYAAHFKLGSVHHAYDKQPRFKGKMIGRFSVLSLRKERLALMVENPRYGRREVEKEGALWEGPQDFVSRFLEKYECPADPSRAMAFAQTFMVWRLEFRPLRCPECGDQRHAAAECDNGG